jgi:hypothetical protein
MVDRETEALLEALRQALAGPPERRLYRAGKLDGLFGGRAGANAAAAARALREGLLEVVRTETRGKTQTDWVRITPRGVDFLHEHESPVCALRELLAALRGSRDGIPDWLGQMRLALRSTEERLSADAQGWLERLAGLERRVEEALRRLESSAPLLPADLAERYPWAPDALNYLDRRRGGGAEAKCPLPELFAAVARHHPELSVASFHDGLRKLHERRALRLAPPGDVSELAQPEYALLDEASVFYYAER